MMTSTTTAVFESIAVPLERSNRLSTEGEQILAHTDFDEPELVNPIIQVTPVESIKRLGTGPGRPCLSGMARDKRVHPNDVPLS
jgi:hypothetical protein